MKLFLILSLALSSIAFADNVTPGTQVIAQLQFAGGLATAGVVSVLDNGSVEFKNTAGDVIAEHALAPLTFGKIQTLAAQIADAKIAVTHSEFVCMSIIAGPQYSLSVATVGNGYEFSGDVHTVLANQGCEFREHTAPTDANLVPLARQLEDLLEVVNAEVLQARQ